MKPGYRSNPLLINTRAEFAEALSGLRAEAGSTFRQISEASGAPTSTFGAWFKGDFLPTPQNEPQFRAVLAALGVAESVLVTQWWDAAMRIRSSDRRPSDVPYRGLEPFGVADAAWFFGRDVMVDEVLARLESTSGILVVTGASGSGKSSLLAAGLAATLSAQSPPRTVTLCTPGNDLPTVEPDAVLIVDQAEELWGPDVTADRRAQYLADLARIPTAATVVGLRADFYGAALAEPILLDALTAGPLVVRPLTVDEMRQVIVAPARRAGASVADDLVELLLADLVPAGSTVADSGVLPLLSHALLGTWQRARRRTLSAQDYLDTGRIGGAIQQSAEQVYSTLSDAERTAARRALLRLVSVDGDTVTRRRMPLEELAVEDSEVLLRFVNARLLTFDEGSARVTHEALLTAWPRLRGWIDDDREWIVQHRSLTQAAATWALEGRDPSLLLIGTRLAFLTERSAVGDRAGDLNDVEREYIAAGTAHSLAGQEADRRRVRTRRRLVMALAAVTVVAVIAAGTALVARSDAVSQRQAADSARMQAQSRQIVSAALIARPRDPALSAQLALAAYRAGATPEAVSMLVDSSGVRTPTRILGAAGGTVVAQGADGVLVVGRPGGEVDVYRAGSTTPAAVVAGPGRSVASLAVDGTGRRFAVSGSGGVLLLDVSDSSAPIVGTAVDVTVPVTNVAFSADGSVLSAGTTDGRVTRWAVSGTALTSLPGLDVPGAGAVSVAVSPDGRWLVGAGRGRALRMWDTARPDIPVIDRASDGSTYTYLGAAFSPDSRSLAFGTTAREIARWTVQPDGQLLNQPAAAGFTSYVNDVAFSPDGAVLAGTSSDNSTRLFDAASASALAVLPGPALVSTVQFSTDGLQLITADQDGTVRLWPMRGPVLDGPGDTVFTVPTDAAGTFVVGGAGVRSDGARVWDLSNPTSPVPGRFPLQASGGDRVDGATTVSLDGRLVAAGTAGGGLTLWDSSSRTAPIRLAEVPAALPELIGGIAINAGRSVVALSQQDASTLALYSVGSAPVRLGSFSATGLPSVIAYSPVADVLAVATSARSVELWDTSIPAAPRRVATMLGFSADASAVAFSMDGSRLAVGSTDNSASIFDVTTITAPQRLSTVTGPAAVNSVSFSRSGSMLALGTSVDSVSLWNITDPGAPRQGVTLTGAATRINDVQFLAGDDRIVAGGAAKSLHIWTLDPETVAAQICATRGTPVTEKEWAQELPGVPYRDLCGQ